MRGTYYAQKIIPCDCGSTEPYWHGPVDGLRDYCCDKCWKQIQKNGTKKRTKKKCSNATR
jgi:hypothetical protein